MNDKDSSTLIDLLIDVNKNLISISLGLELIAKQIEVVGLRDQLKTEHKKKSK